MSTIVPELKLYQIISALIDEVEKDFNRHMDEKDTFLFNLFGDPADLTDNHTNKLGKYDYYKQAKALFVGRKEGDHPRRVNLRMMFDAAKATVPTIHLTMPMEEDQNNEIGIGESGAEGSMIHNTKNNTLTPLYKRRFQTKYHLVCTSDQSQEVFIMYHVLRAAVISALDYIDLAGLKNPQLSGQDVNLNESVAPPHIYGRGFGISCLYQIEIPRYFDTKIIGDILVTGLPIAST